MKLVISILLALALTLSASLAETDDERSAVALCDHLLAGEFEAVTAMFDEKMAAQLSAEALESAWASVAEMYGAHAERLSVEGSQGDGAYAVTVTERFENGALAIQAAFDAEGRVCGLFMKPAAVQTQAGAQTGDWTETELTVEADPAYPLGATLCLPNGVDKPPVVVLVQGSGPSDRNETVMQNMPFADLAHGLAERGIATLRYDKRTYVYPEQASELGAAFSLREEVLDDAHAAIELMLADARVDAARVYLLGHSLGGMLAPAMALENPKLAGAISMAGSLRPLWEIVYDQNQAQIESLRAQGAGGALLDEQAAKVEADVALLRGDLSAQADETLLLGVSVGYWKSLDEYAGMNFIDRVELPLLILQGEADFQVYADADYPLWQRVLEGRDNVQFHLYAGLNHLMMPTQGKRDTSEYMIASRVDEAVMDDIAAFIG